MFVGSNNNAFRKLNQITELAKPKDILAVADSRDIAEELKQNIIDTANNLHGGGTGKLERSIGVRRMENGDYGVTGIDYAKYVNGRDRETFGEDNGFIDEAAAITRQELDLNFLLESLHRLAFH